MFIRTTQAQPPGRSYLWFNIGMAAVWVFFFLLSAWLCKPLGMGIAALVAVGRVAAMIWRSPRTHPEKTHNSNVWLPLALTAVAILAFVGSAHAGQAGGMVISALFAVIMLCVAVRILSETRTA